MDVRQCTPSRTDRGQDHRSGAEALSFRAACDSESLAPEAVLADGVPTPRSDEEGIPVARPPKQRLTLTVSRRLIARARRAARRQEIELNEFLRRCIEGRLNQIESTRRSWGTES